MKWMIKDEAKNVTVLEAKDIGEAWERFVELQDENYMLAHEETPYDSKAESLTLEIDWVMECDECDGKGCHACDGGKLTGKETFQVERINGFEVIPD